LASPTSRPSLEGLGLTPTLLLAMALLLLGCSDDLPSAPATPNTGDSIRETSPPVTRIVERLRERTLSGTADSSLSASVLPENLRARLGVEPGGAGVRFDPSDPDEGDSDEGGAPRISVPHTRTEPSSAR